MTVKYASPKAEAEAKVRAATNALTDAQIRRDQATARGQAAADAAEKWAEEWPNIAEREGRPYYRSDVDGMAVDETGEPVFVVDGPQQRRVNNSDLAVPPPPTGNEIEALESAVAKAIKKLTAATTRAGKIEPEKLEPTGFVVIKPGFIGGTYFTRGDPFPPEQVSPVKFEQLLDNRHIRRVGHG